MAVEEVRNLKLCDGQELMTWWSAGVLDRDSRRGGGRHYKCSARFVTVLSYSQLRVGKLTVIFTSTAIDYIAKTPAGEPCLPLTDLTLDSV